MKKANLNDRLKKTTETLINGASPTEQNISDNKKVDKASIIGNENDNSIGTYTGTNSKTDKDINSSSTSNTNSASSDKYKEVSTLLDVMIEPKDEYIRHVAYLKKPESDFIRYNAKAMSKKSKKRVKESEIFRIAVDCLMNGLNYKEILSQVMGIIEKLDINFELLSPEDLEILESAKTYIHSNKI